jgi:hypothetical protein
VVRSYTGYLFRRLENLEPVPDEDTISAAADQLFDAGCDRSSAEHAIEVLCKAPSPITARILAHAVAEPLLDEDLVAKAFAALKNLWPLPRHYMFYNLEGHPHDDIPYRWFQLFVEVDELTTVDLVLEEFRAHGESPQYREDLQALLDVLHGCRDPEAEDKILGVVNDPATSPEILALLRAFLQEYRPSQPPGPTSWTRHTADLVLNSRYLAAARLFDTGKKAEARRELESILQSSPTYPLALMLHALPK